MTLGSAILNATSTLEQLANPLLLRDQVIPSSLLQHAQGFAFLTLLRVGMGGGGVKLGSGLAVLRREDGSWSAPSAIGMGGGFLGITLGADVVNLCLVLTSKKLCQGFLSRGQLNFEGEIGASMGPVGRNASAGTVGLSPVYSYAQSKGLLFGVDVTGSYIYTRNRVNRKFYGKSCTAEEILTEMPQPEASCALHDAILRLSNAVAIRQTKKARKATDITKLETMQR